MSSPSQTNVLLEVASLSMRLAKKYVEPCSHRSLSGRMPQKERFVLLRETANGYEYVSSVLTHKDAQSLAGADRIEQVDLYEQRDGTIGLVGTPMKEQGGKTLHMGCYFVTSWRVMPPASKEGVVFSLLQTGIHP